MYLLVCIFCICLYVIKKYPYKQIRRRAQKEHIVLLCTDPIGCWMCYFATNNKNIKIIAQYKKYKNHSTPHQFESCYFFFEFLFSAPSKKSGGW